MRCAAIRSWLFGLLFLPLLGLAGGRAMAVEVLVNGTASFNTSDPGAQVPNWTAGWGEAGIDGWDYIGGVNGAVGVYLGNDWVLTAQHVEAGNLTLGGTTYNYIQGTAHGLVDASGSSADLTLFEIANGPNLPSLQLAPQTSVGENVVMIGGGGGKSWGYNTITETDVPTEVNNYSFLSYDFETAYGPIASGTNNAVLIPGDSGGGDFSYDAGTGEWQLVGINEAVNSLTNDSYMIQVSSYLSQIQPISGVPEPGGDVLALLALPLLFLPVFARRKLRGVKTGVS